MKAGGPKAPDSDPEVQRLLEESSAREGVRMAGRELRVELLTACTLAAAVVAMAVWLPAGPSLDVPLAAAMVLTYALAARVEFHAGAGWAVPTQLVLVPMLFALPTAAVPVCVAIAFFLAKLPEHATGTIRADRALIAVGDAWHAVGPALVLSIANVAGPSWGDWPIYVGALAAQFALDFARAVIRGRYVLGLRLRPHLGELGSVYAVDALLAPVGLAIAFASVGASWTFLTVVPLLALIRIFAQEREARIENARALSSAYRGTAHLMAELLTTNHEYTGQHSRSVVVLAHQVGQRLGLDEMALREIEFGALLHDIGKMAVPNEIINKPGRLTSEEFALMRTHTLEGEQMLDRIGGVLGQVGQVVRSHHEHFDGSGYPDGLAGDQIPLAARIVATCDAFSAMTSDRSYRAAMTVPEAIRELRSHAGSQFDPVVVAEVVAVVESWDEAPEITPESVTGQRRFEAIA